MTAAKAAPSPAPSRAVMTGVSYATSAELAGELGPFPEYAANKEAMLRVVRNHRRAAHGETAGYEKLATPPVALDIAAIRQKDLAEAAGRAWDDALAMGKEFGFRNAQATVIAPTGTIGLVMDCDTTGVEPDFALVKFKTLAGGGYFKIINRCVPEALASLGYTESEADAIVAYAVGYGSLESFTGRLNLRCACAARALATSRSAKSRRRWNPPSTSASSSTNGPWARNSAARC